MVALAAYFDESKRKSVVAIAGYIGTVGDWNNRFAPIWRRRVIEAAPRKISEYKAADCRHGRGEFTGWTEAERTAITVSCVDTIIDTAEIPSLIGVGAAALAETPADIGAVPAEGRRGDMEGWAYCWCFTLVVEAALRLSEEHLGKDRLQLIFDDEERLKHRALIMFDVLMECYPQFRDRVNKPKFEDSRQLLPLQAADLLAYETYKEMHSRASDPPRAVSKALSRLVEGRMHVAHQMDGSVIRKLEEAKRTPPPSSSLELQEIYRPYEVCR